MVFENDVGEDDLLFVGFVSLPVEEIPELAEGLEEGNLVYGSRKLGTAGRRTKETKPIDC